jgi:DNA-binding transcriptional LysR family regulator
MFMSVKARYVWIVPAALVASWLAVRSLAANPAYEEEPPLSLVSSTHEIADPALKGLIAHFAAEARRRN